jgi:hypothetical protein
MNHYPLIRTIYLYIFALLGLILVIIGGVRLIDMGLKAFVFTQAEEEQRVSHFYYSRPAYPNLGEGVLEQESLSEQEIVLLKSWLADYESWQERIDKIDPITARRHREASTSLAMIFIGLPLYFYHWMIIKRETSGSLS